MMKWILRAYLMPIVCFHLFANANNLKTYDDPETLEYVSSIAIKLSGKNLLDGDKLPPVYLMSKEDLYRTVCGEDVTNCRNLAAVFDDLGYRILIRDDFDFDSNLDLSFLIHETVHALQYLNLGPEIFRDCSAVLQTETEAYRVQDAFLAREGEFFRAGIALRFFHCDEGLVASDYRKSLGIWKLRKRIPEIKKPGFHRAFTNQINF